MTSGKFNGFIINITKINIAVLIYRFIIPYL